MEHSQRDGNTRPPCLSPKKPACRSRSNSKKQRFKIGKGVCQSYILSPCLFNFYVEYIMQNACLDEAQAGIKITGRNISNFRYADDTTLMAESKQELKSLLMKVKVQNEKAGLNNSAFKKPDHGIRPHHFMANRWGKMKTLTDLIFRVP